MNEGTNMHEQFEARNHQTKCRNSKNLDFRAIDHLGANFLCYFVFDSAAYYIKCTLDLYYFVFKKKKEKKT